MGRISQLKRELIEEANKTLLGEALGEEPVRTIKYKDDDWDGDKNIVAYEFYFPEGDGKHPEGALEDPEGFGGDWLSPFDDSVRKKIVDAIRKELRPTLPTIFKFVGSEFEDQLEGIIELSSRTSSSGSEKGNMRVGKERLNFVKDIVIEALNSLGVRDTRIQQLVTSYTKSDYSPSNIADYLDPEKVGPNGWEQRATITINPVETQGLDVDSITQIKGKMDKSTGTFSSDEEGVVNAIKRLETYSDIEDLNDRYVNAKVGTLERAINKAITDGLTVWGSDTQERRRIVNHLNKIAEKSGKTQVAKENPINGNITIILAQ